MQRSDASLQGIIDREIYCKKKKEKVGRSGLEVGASKSYFCARILAISIFSTQIHCRRCNQKGDERMNENIFNSLNTYRVLYFYLASGGKTREEILKHLKANGKSSTTAKDHAGKAEDRKITYISCENGKFQLDRKGVSEFLTELAGSFQYDITLEPKQHKKKRKPEDEYEPFLTSHSPGYQNLIAQANSTKAVEKNLKERIKKKDAEIKRLKNLLSAKIDDAVLGEMKPKVLVVGSANVKPKEKFQRDFFLDDPGRLLDVEELVSKYGGEINNPYEQVLSVEKELTTEN